MYLFFFFQAEDGIRDVLGSRGLGDCIRDGLLGYPHLVRGEGKGLGEGLLEG